MLDRQGRFSHDGDLIENARMTEAFFKWLRRHPDDGRYILSNDYDWTYLTVEDAPFFVRSVKLAADGVWLRISDGSTEQSQPRGLRIGQDLARLSATTRTLAPLRGRRTFCARSSSVTSQGFGINISSVTLTRFWTMLAHYHGQLWKGSTSASATVRLPACS